MKNAKRLLSGVILFLACVTTAFAQGGGRMGGGYGRHMMGDNDYPMGPGMMYADPQSGGCMMDEEFMGPDFGYGYGRGMMRGQGGPDLTPEQREQLNNTRQKFFSETQSLRERIREKRYALQQELGSQDPDEAKLDQLQQELSDLHREFDQKRMEHQLEVSHIFGADLSREQLDQITAERRQFFTETQDLRNSIREKRLELQQEMFRPDPDEEKVLGLQAELSDLRAQFDQKRIQHQLELRKIMPEAAGTGGMGAGRPQKG